MKTSEHKGTGLNPLPANPGGREDISHARVFGVLGAAEIPGYSFDVAEPMIIKDQKSLDFCTGFADSSVNEDQEHEEMDPLWQFAAIKRIMKDPKPWGADLRSAGMALVTYGSLPQRMAPYKIDEKDRDFLADWKNYPISTWNYALRHKKQTMFFVDGPHDLYGNIIMTLWQNRVEKRSVLLGVKWRYTWNTAPGGIIPDSGWENDKGEGHCVKGFGQALINGKLYLKVQNSWGTDVGDRGVFYFPREVVNSEFGPFGQITFKDMDPEDAHYMNERNITVSDSRLKKFWKALVFAFNQLFNRVKFENGK